MDDRKLYHTNCFLPKRPTDEAESYNFRVTETYYLPDREIHPSYETEIPARLVTFCRHSDETWEVAVDYNFVKKIMDKGTNQVYLWPLFGA